MKRRIDVHNALTIRNKKLSQNIATIKDHVVD